MNLWLKTWRQAIALLLGLSLTGPWALLQTAAWASMLITNIRTDDFCTTVVKTFDGRHPCALCLQIRKGQQEEQRNTGQLPGEKPEKMPELFCDTPAVAVPRAPATTFDLPAFPLDHYSGFVESPPKPPPRVRVAVL